MRLISSRLLPDEGSVFVPTHLRVLFAARLAFEGLLV